MSDFLPILLAVLVLTVSAIYSAKWGLVPILALGSAMVIGVLVFLGVFHFLPELSDLFFDLPLGWKPATVVGLILSIAVFILAWYPAVLVSRRLFGPDSALHGVVDGFPAALLSIIPSAVVIAVLFSCFRSVGTVQELRYVAALGSEEISSYPKAAVWRDQIESIPGVTGFLDRIDPFSPAAYRNAAALVLLGQDPSTRSFFDEQEETSPALSSALLTGLDEVSSIESAIQENNHFALVLNPSIRGAARDLKLFPVLESLKLRPVLKRFVDSLNSSADPDTTTPSN